MVVNELKSFYKRSVSKRNFFPFGLQHLRRAEKEEKMDNVLSPLKFKHPVPLEKKPLSL